MIAEQIFDCQSMHNVLQSTRCGDEVQHGKLAQDCFCETAPQIGIHRCLVPLPSKAYCCADDQVWR